MVELIQPLLAPAVMFSAGGLLCMAQFARLTAVIAQVRVFNRERLECLQAMKDAPEARRAVYAQRSQGLEHQAAEVLSHARIIRNALMFLVAGILWMLLCSLVVGASYLWSPLGEAVVPVFVVGLVSTFVGMCLVFQELFVSLDVVRFEHDNLERLRGEGELLSREFRGID